MEIIGSSIGRGENCQKFLVGGIKFLWFSVQNYL